MAGLVSYDSADSENEEISQSKCERNEMPVSVGSASVGAGDLEAEWESFEKLISSSSTGTSEETTVAPAGGGNSTGGPSGVPCPSLATFPPSFSPPPLISSSKPTGADNYEKSLHIDQNVFSCIYEPENAQLRKTSSSTQDSDSDMDVCSNSSGQQRSPPSRRPTTSSVSSSAILAANEEGANSDLASDSESGKSDKSSMKETKRKRFSESSFDDSDEDKQPEKRVRRTSSSSGSQSGSHCDDNEDNKNAISSAMMHTPSSDSDKSESPKMTSSPDLPAARKVVASNCSETASKNDAEPKDASTQDRLRSKLLALAEEKVRASRSKSHERSKRRNSRHSPSPSRRHRGGDRTTDRHKKRRSSRSVSRERRRRSRDGHGRRRHSKSRSPRRRSHRSRSRSHSRRHYRDRRDRRPSHRSRSRDRERVGGDKRRKGGGGSRSPPRPKMNFKEQLKAQLMQVQKQTAEDITQDIAVIENKPLVTANEKKSMLPLNNPNPLTAMVTGSKDKVTPQQALMQTMAAMHAKAQELTGVAVPSYYNPAAVNPLKYAEQLKKRKLLWSKNKEIPEGDKEVESKAQWTSTSFASDQDGKMAAKFRKLMGIKEEDKMLLLDNVDLSKLTEEQRQRQEELFMQLDREYAFARMTTHTHRGIGLGFQSQGLPD